MTEISDFKALDVLDLRKAKATGVFARDKLGRPLLQVRDNFDFVKMGGWIGFFGGHLEEGENLADCAVREFKEETNIEIQHSELIPRVSLSSESSDNMLLFVLELKRRIQPSEPVIGEGAGFVFLDWTDFDRYPITPTVLRALSALR
ncbi:MAG: NUDIX domain-containing protein [Pseudomonadota bacterium]